MLSGAVVVGSLLAVAGAHAELTQGQVRLTTVQHQLDSEITHHRDLELRVAQLEDPAHIVQGAQQQGMVPPRQVTDLPPVDLSRPLPAPPTTLATDAAPAGATGPAGTSVSGARNPSGGAR